MPSTAQWTTRSCNSIRRSSPWRRRRERCGQSAEQAHTGSSRESVGIVLGVVVGDDYGGHWHGAGDFADEAFGLRERHSARPAEVDAGRFGGIEEIDVD